MSQDRESGEAGRQFGRECGPRTAEEIGARWIGGVSNECLWEGKRALIKCAQRKKAPDPAVGVPTHMLDRIDLVLGVFQVRGQEFEVIVLTTDEYRQHMHDDPADEKRGKQGKLKYSHFKRYGKPLCSIVFDPPLTTVAEAKEGHG